MEEQSPAKNEVETPIDFLAEIEKLTSVEQKLRACIHWMRLALAKEGAPDFKGFWHVRKICLPLFKETLAAPLRSSLWDEYVELTREGRRLKDLMDGETAFAVEQIELAIKGLEKELTDYSQNPEQTAASLSQVEFSKPPKALQREIETYKLRQAQVNQFNFFATRIQALRKELMKTEMRVRQKNAFFEALSKLGDLIFPPRKELISQISEAFLKDVDWFIKTNFTDKDLESEQAKRSVFFLREEIKLLQNAAKTLTLTAQAFAQTRQNLSQCWDKLKGAEKELRKEFAEQKQASLANAEAIRAEITAFSEKYQAAELTVEQAHKALEQIGRNMRAAKLTRNDVLALKEALKVAAEPLEAKKNAEENARKHEAALLEKGRKEKVQNLQKDIESLLARTGQVDVAALKTDVDQYKKALAQINGTKVEKQNIEHSLRLIRDQIALKEQQALLALPKGDLEALEGLKELLKTRQEERKEIKATVEQYRKITGGSGLDFEKAMEYGELLEREKMRLAAIDEAIKEIEKKIRELSASAS